MLPADISTKGAAIVFDDKSTYAVELFKQVPADTQERIIALIQFLLTGQEQDPADQKTTD